MSFLIQAVSHINGYLTIVLYSGSMRRKDVAETREKLEKCMYNSLMRFFHDDSHELQISNLWQV